MQERRKFIRVNDYLKISFKLVNGFLGSSSQSDNLSEGGIQLPVDTRFEKGTILEIKENAAEWDKPIEAVGEIAWFREVSNSRHPFLVGIKFIKIIPSALEKIRKHVNKLRIQGPTGGVELWE